MEGTSNKSDMAILIDDMVRLLESKVYNIIGLLELVDMGATHINSRGSYELSCINVLKDYLLLINKVDIPKLHEMLKQLSGKE